jgi:hypothetical protein
MEKKSKQLKSSMTKNALLNYNQNKHINKLEKNNKNFGFDLNPLKGSLTIEKLDTPARNKTSNQNLNANITLNIYNKANNFVNPFNLNGSKENKLNNNINKNAEYKELEDKKVCVNSAVLNEESKNSGNKEYPVERIEKRKRSVTTEKVISLDENENAENFG